jgi:hypothetical protein
VPIDKQAIKQKKAALADLERQSQENCEKRIQLQKEIDLLSVGGWPQVIPNGTVVRDSFDSREGILFTKHRENEINLSTIVNGEDDVFLLDAGGLIVPFHQSKFSKDIRIRFQIIGSANPVRAVAAALSTAKKNSE